MSTSAPMGVIPVPPGETADFDIYHKTNIQVEFLVAYCITLAFATITLVLRIYTRLFVNCSPGVDDVLVSLAMVSSLAYFVISVYCFRFGFGRHLWEVTELQLEGYMQYLMGIAAPYIWAPALTKLSFLVLLHRLNDKRWFRVGIYFLSFAIFTYSMVIVLVLAYPCSALKPNTGNCLNRCALWQGILNIVTDILTVCLPVHMVYRLHVPLRQKIILVAIFSTSIFVTIICIVRLTYVMTMQNNVDVTFTQAQAAIWSSVELNIGIFCASIVVLKPFLRRHFPRLFSSTDDSDEDPSSNRHRPRAYFAAFRPKDPNTFHLTSIDGGGKSSLKGKFGRGDKHSGITVTNSYKVDATNVETESMEGIIESRDKYGR